MEELRKFKFCTIAWRGQRNLPHVPTLPMTDKLLALQNCNLFLTFDICSLNICSDVSVFPTQRPRIITLPFVHLQSKSLLCQFLHFLINSPSVFSMFILAPVAFSYFSSSLKASFTELSFVAKFVCHLHIIKSFALYLKLLFLSCFDLILFGCQGPPLLEHKAEH